MAMIDQVRRIDMCNRFSKTWRHAMIGFKISVGDEMIVQIHHLHFSHSFPIAAYGKSDETVRKRDIQNFLSRREKEERRTTLSLSLSVDSARKDALRQTVMNYRAVN